MESIVHMILDIIQIENPSNLFFRSLSATRYEPVADRTTATILAISNKLVIFVAEFFFCDKFTLAMYFCTDDAVRFIYNSTDIISCDITFAIMAFEGEF